MTVQVKRFEKFAFVLMLAFFILTASGQNLSADDLRASAVAVRSIDFADEDFSDLTPLKKKIKGAKIVVLGEATHSEGTTTRAKLRMVKFLHEKMGFDVLVWESGMFSSYALNEKLRDADFPLAEARKEISTWGAEEGAQPLFAYARNSWKTKTPLVMAGIDRSRTPSSPAVFLEYFRKFFERAPAFRLNDEERKIFESFANRAFSVQKPKNQLPPDAQRRAERAFYEDFLARLKSARAELGKQFSGFELDFAERFVEDALQAEEFNYQAAFDFQKANAFRDKMMAENFLWLTKKLYPNKKIILWGATSHFLRNSPQIKNVKEGWTHPDWYMGNRIYPAVKDGIYTIAFTSYAGRYGLTFENEEIKPRVEEETQSAAGSFEAAAHALRQPFLFVDLKNASENSPLRARFVSLALGRDENSAKWSDSVDAFFFIDKAEPRRILK